MLRQSLPLIALLSLALSGCKISFEDLLKDRSDGDNGPMACACPAIAIEPTISTKLILINDLPSFVKVKIKKYSDSEDPDGSLIGEAELDECQDSSRNNPLNIRLEQTKNNELIVVHQDDVYREGFYSIEILGGSSCEQELDQLVLEEVEISFKDIEFKDHNYSQCCGSIGRTGEITLEVE